MLRALNVGCGLNPPASTDEIDWTHLDIVDAPGVDVVCDLEHSRLPFPDDHFDHIEASHVLEHLDGLLAVVEELWRVTRPGGLLVCTVPYGASDEAWEDPTHRRAFFQGSWRYFSQPLYWRTNYGYKGDWDLERVRLRIPSSRVAGLSSPEVFDRVRLARNVVHEMIAELRCVKPARVAEGQPVFSTNIVLEMVDLDPDQVRF